jgi:hypothetical protein
MKTFKSFCEQAMRISPYIRRQQNLSLRLNQIGQRQRALEKRRLHLQMQSDKNDLSSLNNPTF